MSLKLHLAQGMYRHANRKYATVLSGNFFSLLIDISDYTDLENVRITVQNFPIVYLSNAIELTKIRPFISSIDFDGIPSAEILKFHRNILDDLVNSIELYLKEDMRNVSNQDIADNLNRGKQTCIDYANKFDIDNDFNDKGVFFTRLRSEHVNHPLDREYLEAALSATQLEYVLGAFSIRKKLWERLGEAFESKIVELNTNFNQIRRLDSAAIIPATTLVEIMDIFRKMNFITDNLDMDKFEMHNIALLGIDKRAYQKARSAHLNNGNFKKLMALVDHIDNINENSKRKSDK